jgi:iron(III) transport system ATP-binding protein
MRFEIKELVTQLNMTAVYVTHDQAEALALSDRVAVMNAGRIQQVGTPREIYEQPRTLFVADFIGLSDFLHGQVATVERDFVRVTVKALELTVHTAAEVTAGQAVILFIRPNSIQLMKPGAGTGANIFDGRVSKMTYLGDTIDYRVVLSNGLELRIQTDGRQYFEPGSPVRVRLPPDRCHIIAEGA